jgi:hypothetical protein
MNGSFLAGAPREADQGAKNTHLRRYLIPRRCDVHEYVSLLGISAALHLGIFEQPKGRISFCFAESLLTTGGFEIENHERSG